MAKRRKIPLPGPLVSGFAAECEAAGMRISKSEATVLSGEKDGEPTLGQEGVTAPTGGLQVSQSSCSQVRGEKRARRADCVVHGGETRGLSVKMFIYSLIYYS